MKMRVRKVANFLAFNLLFFALYLNFIQQDRQTVLNVDKNLPTAAAAFGGTIIVDHQDKSLGQQATATGDISGKTIKAQTAKRTIN